MHTTSHQRTAFPAPAGAWAATSHRPTTRVTRPVRTLRVRTFDPEGVAT